MKRFITVFLLLAVVITLASCAKNQDDVDSSSVSTVSGMNSDGSLNTEAAMDYLIKSGEIKNYAVSIHRQSGVTTVDTEYKSNGEGLYIKRETVYDTSDADVMAVVSSKIEYYDQVNGKLYTFSGGAWTTDEKTSDEITLSGALNEALGEEFFGRVLSGMVSASYNSVARAYVLPDFTYAVGEETRIFENSTLSLDSSYRLSAFACDNGMQAVTVTVSRIGGVSVDMSDVPTE